MITTKNILPLLLLPIFACTPKETIDPDPDPAENVITYDIESLVAVDPAGKEIAFDYREPREKDVGIFYFIWQGAHGYDEPAYHGGEIPPPTASDVNSPYDISEMEVGYTNPQDIPFAGPGVMHHWGKPYLDYYVANDRWVIRRHAQMLAEAGVDVIFIDVTNGYSYLPVLKVLCDVYWKMWREGNPTPQISFVLNYVIKDGQPSAPIQVVKELMTLYQNSDYKKLWYQKDGKPLLLAPLENYGPTANNFFTFRYAWFDSQRDGSAWWGDGTNKWTWGEYYPQRDVKEEMSVMAGSHANFNIGRSFTGNSPEGAGGHQPVNTTPEQRAAGTYFKQQFERAIQCDPDLVFITGWNEWTAQRQVNTPNIQWPWFLGQQIGLGDSFFVDCYNHEYSRDIEPLANDFRDTYYYYMVDYVRRYKGVSAVEPVKEFSKISIDGKFADWAAVGTRYRDYQGDTEARDHWGYGYKNRSLTNTTGRNDFRFAKVATDGTNLYFNVETLDNITPRTGSNWMRLFISVKGSSAPNWEGFQWVVNNRVESDSRTTLQRSKGGWQWEDAGTVEYAVAGKQMELAIPLSMLEITDRTNFTVDFKWIDNSVADGDICECMIDGDSAPGNRFRYRYIFRN